MNNNVQHAALHRGLLRAVWLAALLLVSGMGSAVQAADPPPPADREQQLEAARARLEQAAREVAELSLEDSGRRNIIRFRTQGSARAALGINIGSQQGQNSTEDGVPVLSVSPGGPAAEAGIRAGDVLVSVDDRVLKAENGRSPQAALLTFMEAIEPGTTVQVEYRRDGKPDKVAVVAQPLMPPFTAGARLMPMPGGLPPIESTMGPGMTFFRGQEAFGAIELVPLTPKLGQYFGADKGLLVVRAPVDSRLGLEEGDVVLDIAGRIPATPAHAMRILDSYQPGEKLAMNILRLKKKLTLNVEIPAEARRGGMLFEGPAIQAVPFPGNGNVLFNVPVPPPVVTPLPPGA